MKLEMTVIPTRGQFYRCKIATNSRCENSFRSFVHLWIREEQSLRGSSRSTLVIYRSWYVQIAPVHLCGDEISTGWWLIEFFVGTVVLLARKNVYAPRYQPIAPQFSFFFFLPLFLLFFFFFYVEIDPIPFVYIVFFNIALQPVMINGCFVIIIRLYNYC